MRLPRWSVVLLLGTSILSAWTAFGWWWVVRPELTTRNFLDSLTDHRLEDAADILEDSLETEHLMHHANLLTSHFLKEHFISEPRTAWDIISGRHRFTLMGSGCTAQFGRISHSPSTRYPRVKDASRFTLVKLSPSIAEFRIKSGPMYFWTLEGSVARDRSSDVVVFGGVAYREWAQVKADGTFSRTVWMRHPELEGLLTVETVQCVASFSDGRVDEEAIPERTRELTRDYQQRLDELPPLRAVAF